MMTSLDTYQACKALKHWEITANFSVGGFEWLAFSKREPGRMIVIFAQRTTLVNCDTGENEDCAIAFDETELIAYCDRLPDEELSIAGAFGGQLPHETAAGERVTVETNDAHIMKVHFVQGLFSRKLIYHSYDAYLCGFSDDGRYFVLADDGGILIIRKHNA